MRSTARVVVIGGGIHGAATLYHLAREGITDTLLVEKAELTSGSTWHAAGQITRSLGDYTTAAFHHYAIQMYETIEEETGQAVSLHQPGGLRVAYTEAEVEALKAQIGIGRYIGYPIELIGPDEMKQFAPFYDTTDILAAIWTEGEGHVDPSGATMACIAGARAAGAEVSRRNRVIEVTPHPEGWSVVTEKGTVVCEHVVDAAGCYADQVAQMSGFRVPQANVLHHYLVTESCPDFVEHGVEMPVMRDNRVAGYIRQEQESGLIGIYETSGAEAAWLDGVPWEAENPLFDENYELIGKFLEEAFRRLPVLENLGIKRVVRGAITHTTDAHMLLGPAPGLRNYWLNTGSSIGLAWGPGAGRELARWIAHGETELNLRHYDPRRYGWITPEYTLAKSLEDYEWMFRVHQPGEERFAHRPVRTSPLYDTLTDQRAIHSQAFGWEQPKWFVPEDMPLEDACGFRRPAWFEPVRAEVAAVRERVGLLDLSAFSKYEVTGADAGAFLDRMVTNKVPTSDGRMALAYALTPTGRIETEVTITRLAADRFYMVSGPMGEVRDFDWFDQHIAHDEDVTITDLSTTLGVLVVAGPNSRELIARCTDQDMSHKGFPWLRGKRVTVCGVEVLALRVGFTGALGWELHAPIADLKTVYDGLWAAGEDLGVANFGSHALNSLRMEKAYLTRFELTHDIGPVQAGVGRFVRKDKTYIGSDTLDEPTTGNDWRLVYLDVDADDADCHGGEGVFNGDRAVGLTTSGGYGFTVEKSLAFAYVDEASAAPGTTLQVLILNDLRDATVLESPVFDPANDTMRQLS